MFLSISKIRFDLILLLLEGYLCCIVGMQNSLLLSTLRDYTRDGCRGYLELAWNIHIIQLGREKRESFLLRKPGDRRSKLWLISEPFIFLLLFSIYILERVPDRQISIRFAMLNMHTPRTGIQRQFLKPWWEMLRRLWFINGIRCQLSLT